MCNIVDATPRTRLVELAIIVNGGNCRVIQKQSLDTERHIWYPEVSCVRNVV